MKNGNISVYIDLSLRLSSVPKAKDRLKDKSCTLIPNLASKNKLKFISTVRTRITHWSSASQFTYKNHKANHSVATARFSECSHNVFH
jgi:hypothetical protein